MAYARNLLPFNSPDLYSMRYDHFLLYLVHHNYTVNKQRSDAEQNRKIKENIARMRGK